MAISNEVNKKITFNNKIKVNGVQTVLQSYSINIENFDLNRSQPIINQELYKENRSEIRKIMEDFEDYVYEEQDDLIKNNALRGDE